MSELQKEYYIPFVANTKNKLFLTKDEKSKKNFYFFKNLILLMGPWFFLMDTKKKN